MSISSKPSKTKQVQLTVNVPDDSSIEVRQFTTWRKYLSDWHHVRMSQEGSEFLASSDLNGTDFKVLNQLLGVCEFENIINIPQSEIAKKLKTDQQAVSKSVKRLIAMKLLCVIGQDGRRNIYLLNPYFAFKSKAKNHKALTEYWDSLHSDTEIEA